VTFVVILIGTKSQVDIRYTLIYFEIHALPFDTYAFLTRCHVRMDILTNEKYFLSE